MKKNSRKNFSENTQQFLYDEAKGKCPLCLYSLTYEKNNKLYKDFEIAHIYPLNPTKDEIELLKDEIRLGNVNDLTNLIALCPNCHNQYDKPRTIEEYRNLVKIKQRLLKNNEILKYYSSFYIEEEIANIIENIVNCDLNEDNEELSFKLMTVDNKTNNSCPLSLQKHIKRNVAEYFNYIRSLFTEIDKNIPGKFDAIASQIKSFYKKCQMTNSNQEWIYYQLVDWLCSKTQTTNKISAEIIIAFFIQDCEVFS